MNNKEPSINKDASSPINIQSQLPQESNRSISDKYRTFRNSSAFLICGLINNFGYVVFLSAAEDLVRYLTLNLIYF